MSERVLQFSSATPADVRSELRHRGRSIEGSTLNNESIKFAWLFQHATTELRQRLYDVVRANPCSCIGCQSGVSKVR